MIKRPDLLEAFEKEQIHQRPADYFENLRIFEALHQEAQALGVFPLADPLDGIEVDIRLVRALRAGIVSEQDGSRDSED